MSREDMIDKQNEPESQVSADNQPAENAELAASNAVQDSDQSANQSAIQSAKPKTAPDRQAGVAGSFVPDIAKLPDDANLYEAAGNGQANRLWNIPTLGWFVLVALLICGVAAGLKVILYEEPIPKVNVRVAAGDKKVGEIITRQEDESKKIRRILVRMNECARGYLKADSIDQKLAYVRHAKRVRPLMEKYYNDHQMVAEQFRRFSNYQALKIDGSSFVLGRVELIDGVIYELLMEQLGDGSFKVDWESDVCYQAMAWSEFIRSRPTQSLVMRVGARPDNFYAYEFSEDQYDCFKLTASGSNDHVFGYAIKGSEVSIAMRSFLMQVGQIAEDKSEPVTLLLRFPESDRSSNCVYIERMMAPRWIFVHQHEAEKKKTEGP